MDFKKWYDTRSMVRNRKEGQIVTILLLLVIGIVINFISYTAQIRYLKEIQPGFETFVHNYEAKSDNECKIINREISCPNFDFEEDETLEINSDGFNEYISRESEIDEADNYILYQEHSSIYYLSDRPHNQYYRELDENKEYTMLELHEYHLNAINEHILRTDENIFTLFLPSLITSVQLVINYILIISIIGLFISWIMKVKIKFMELINLAALILVVPLLFLLTTAIFNFIFPSVNINVFIQVAFMTYITFKLYSAVKLIYNNDY